jgi:hypothetical protein
VILLLRSIFSAREEKLPSAVIPQAKGSQRSFATAPLVVDVSYLGSRAEARASTAPATVRFDRATRMGPRATETTSRRAALASADSFSRAHRTAHRVMGCAAAISASYPIRLIHLVGASAARTGILVDATLIPSASIRHDGEARWAHYRCRKPADLTRDDNAVVVDPEKVERLLTDVDRSAWAGPR